MKNFVCILGVIALLVQGCGCNNSSSQSKSLASRSSGDMQSYLNTDVNAIEQALPTIMIIPSDLLLKGYGCLSQVNVEGKTFVQRDYQSYLLKDNKVGSIISKIQESFVNDKYPISDFSQILKQLENSSALDIADGIIKDAKTELLATAKPDIILELNYKKVNDLLSHDYSSGNSYSITAIDAYSGKVLSSVSIEEKLNDGDPLGTLKQDLLTFFNETLVKGRDVTLRINLDKNSSINLSDISVQGDTYSDWIVDYVKVHTVKGAYNLQKNTDKELYFINVRIPLLNDDGTQFSVYDWARNLSKNIRENLGLSSVNRSQGLGEIVLTIK